MNHILLVDDEKDIVDICQTYFEYEGYTVTTASNGEEALQHLNDSIDLIVLDIMMPELNGYDVVKEMKQRQLDIPFIYLSAKTQEQDTIYALTLGADDYMTKPFSPRELVLRANNLLNRVRKCMNLQSSLRFGALELNDTQKRALIYDEPVNLRIKEFELLWYLGKHENEVISKSELIQEVWQYDYYEDVNTVNVHIHRLREKFEQFNYHDYTIKTVWGLGYTFERKQS
ncbi:response regulator saeR (fragment 1) [Staphylococcus piscifermentans]|uniref:Response regulator SaeR n=1 Tax=Staphylococcus piscifermentans TaxID=70258 RepID=A0A239UG01_9STAP|nr:response regulator transcription factor [Staphylococcus piscifermentans]RTX84869.1 response regulator transcription factor [Staphylococcus piscifermentans]GEP83804.1 response regulator SaeR [Staphylococcus piscifermentans]SNV08024.1 response regulator saeR (fragment 1) [Staphylococcus piscifermentans]